jgi:hypothetical protein
VLDPAQLSASLSRILSDPAAKEKLQVELASNDLQTAVLIVGQTLRSVDVPAQPQAPLTVGTQVASLSGTRDSVVSGLETLIVGTTPGETDEEKSKELARSVQTELRRLGCYRLEVDGDWGGGSSRALADYYRNTRQQIASTEPTVELLGDLFLQSGRICKAPVMVKKVKQTNMASDTDRKASGKTGGKGTKQRSTKRSSTGSRPAAPPPDISGGIGIGGVF